MYKQFRILLLLTAFFSLVMITQVSAQAPPPPGHSQNGNQASPGGGTGCPLDRTQGILLAVVLSLGYAGFALYQKNRRTVQVDEKKPKV